MSVYYSIQTRKKVDELVSEISRGKYFDFPNNEYVILSAEDIEQKKKDLAYWKTILHQEEMIEFEDKVGFKSMERNAGVWNEE